MLGLCDEGNHDWDSLPSWFRPDGAKGKHMLAKVVNFRPLEKDGEQAHGDFQRNRIDGHGALQHTVKEAQTLASAHHTSHGRR